MQLPESHPAAVHFYNDCAFIQEPSGKFSVYYYSPQRRGGGNPIKKIYNDINVEGLLMQTTPPPCSNCATAAALLIYLCCG